VTQNNGFPLNPFHWPVIARLEMCVLACKGKLETPMTRAEPTTNVRVLLVDDEVEHLRLRAYVMMRCGFSVITAGDALQAVALMEEETMEKVDIAILDYHMPVMNGCMLADRLRSMRPELKIILNSGAIDIPQSEMTSVDVFISKADGTARLLAQVVEFAQAGSDASAPLVSANELSLRMRSGRS
jgi:CheY-like chemotaxis protein